MKTWKFRKKVALFIEENNLFKEKDQILVAVSGGPDSIALATVLIELGYEIALAHCNFQLRGEDANDDELFVLNFAKKNNLEFYNTSFNTEIEANKRKISIQMAARELRYAWLEEIRGRYNYSYVAVAHHQSDQVETILLNIARGCGLEGLSGMQKKSTNVVRPILFAAKADILDYLLELGQDFRVDGSNNENKYLRNNLRLDIIPLLKKVNPQFNNHVVKLGERMLDIQKFVNHQANKEINKFTTWKEDKFYIQIPGLLQSSSPTFLLYEAIKSFGFKNEDIQEILNSINGNPGKTFFAGKFRLIKDREFLIISAIETQSNFKEIEILDFENSLSSATHLKFERCEASKFKKNDSVASINVEKVIFPVKIRNWVKGDRFVPLGMKGKKKVSDLLIDLKIPLLEKEEVKVLENGDGEIIWVVGIRMSDKFKFLKGQKEFWRVSILDNKGSNS